MVVVLVVFVALIVFAVGALSGYIYAKTETKMRFERELLNRHIENSTDTVIDDQIYFAAEILRKSL